MNNDLVSNIAIVAGLVGIVVGVIGVIRGLRKKYRRELTWLNHHRKEHKTHTHLNRIDWTTSTTPLTMAIGVGGCFGALFGIRGAVVGVVVGLVFGFTLLRKERHEQHRNQSNRPADEHEA